MSSVVISGDTSGAITLASPAVAGTNTATLPAATGTVMVSGNMPAFSAYRSPSSQSFSQNTFTKVQFNQEVFDTNNNYDSSTNYRFTPTVAGYYQISSPVGIAAGATYGRVICSVYKNGNEYIRQDCNLSVGLFAYTTATVNSLVYCNGSTDYIEIYVYCNSSSPNVDAGTAPYASSFSGTMVRGA